MFDGCSKAQDDARCTAVAGKLALLFGWRQTYNVAKLQRSLTLHPAKGFVRQPVQKTYSLDQRVSNFQLIFRCCVSVEYSCLVGEFPRVGFIVIRVLIL